MNLTLMCLFTYLRASLLQIRTKLRKSLKWHCHCKKLASGVIYKFHYGFFSESYYGYYVRDLNVKFGKHIKISPLKKKRLTQSAKPLARTTKCVQLFFT